MVFTLMPQDATICICRGKTCDLAQFTTLADILIMPAGKPNLERTAVDMNRCFAAFSCFLSISAPAAAMVGGAAAVTSAHSAVTIVGSRGNFCTSVDIARDLMLTAARRVMPSSDYKLVEYECSGSRTCA